MPKIIPIEQTTLITSGWIGSGYGFTSDKLPIWDAIRAKFEQDFPGVPYEMKASDSKFVMLEVTTTADKLSQIQAHPDYSDVSAVVNDNAS